MLNPSRKYETDFSHGCFYDAYSPWASNSGWRLNEDNYHHIEFRFFAEDIEVVAHFRKSVGSNRKQFLFEIGGKEHLVKGFVVGNDIHIDFNGHQIAVHFNRCKNKLVLFKNATSWELEIIENQLGDVDQDEQPNLLAPMPGTIVEVLVGEGDYVEQGQAMIIMEAMKMEHTISAHKNIQIDEVVYQVGDLVDEGAELITFIDE